MTKEQAANEMDYQLSLLSLNRMKESNCLSDEEFQQAKEKLRDFYHPVIGSLLCESTCNVPPSE